VADKALKVLFVSAEVAPFSSVGGLSQVSYFLPRTLAKTGVDIRIFTPKYGTINESKFPVRMEIEGLRIPTGEIENSDHPTDLVANVKTFREKKMGFPPVYFLENQEYFEKRANVYGYSDDHIRFGLLSRGALEFIRSQNFIPDLVHLNDWHTAYFANYFQDYCSDDPILKKTAILLSVHNLFQGNFDFEHAKDLDFDDGKGKLASLYSERFLKQNALKRGVMRADVVNTVSETYASEIILDEYGKGLHNLFKEVRGKVFGVLNGLDYKDFNPQTDKLIRRNYNYRNLNLRSENKADLQKQFNLTIDPAIPILCFWGRMDTQKGIDLIMDTAVFILDEMNIQLVVMGQPGEDRYRQFFTELEKNYPGQVGTHLMSDFALPHRIVSGADMLLMPSKYEPGGIVAVEALRYGCIPIVRSTGGLADIVINFDPAKNIGNGFTFKKYTRENFLVAIVRALETYKNSVTWNRIVKRAMQADFSWNKSAQSYLDLYNRAIEFRREKLQPNPPMAFKQTVS